MAPFARTAIECLLIEEPYSRARSSAEVLAQRFVVRNLTVDVQRQLQAHLGVADGV
jgi:hypothetical protein